MSNSNEPVSVDGNEEEPKCPLILKYDIRFPVPKGKGIKSRDRNMISELGIRGLGNGSDWTDYTNEEFWKISPYDREATVAGQVNSMLRDMNLWGHRKGVRRLCHAQGAFDNKYAYVIANVVTGNNIHQHVMDLRIPVLKKKRTNVRGSFAGGLWFGNFSDIPLKSDALAGIRENLVKFEAGLGEHDPVMTLGIKEEARLWHYYIAEEMEMEKDGQALLDDLEKYWKIKERRKTYQKIDAGAMYEALKGIITRKKGVDVHARVVFGKLKRHKDYPKFRFKSFAQFIRVIDRHFIVVKPPWMDHRIVNHTLI